MAIQEINGLFAQVLGPERLAEAGARVAAAVAAGAPPTPEELERLVKLPPTDQLEAAVTDYNVMLDQEYAEAGAWSQLELDRFNYLQARLKAGERRDTLMADRQALGKAYAGCWCLGLGGRDRVAMALRFDGRVHASDFETWRQFCTCPDGLAAHNAHDKAYHELEQQARTRQLARIFGPHGVPALFRDKTATTWRKAMLDAGADADKVKLVLDRCSEWWANIHAIDTDVDLPRLLVMAGDYGTGKSCLSYAMGQRWYAEGGDLLFRRVSELFDALRSASRRFGREEADQFEIIKAVRSAGLLILDDLGADALTDAGEGWVVEKLNDVLSYRLENLLPTLVNTNLTAAQVQSGYGERMANRLAPDRVSIKAVFAGLPNLRKGGW